MWVILSNSQAVSTRFTFIDQGDSEMSWKKEKAKEESNR
jgi:hypothetical protein